MIGCQPAMVCTQVRACSLSVSRGKCRRNSTMAASSPSSLKALWIASAAAVSTTNILASSSTQNRGNSIHACTSPCTAPRTVRNKHWRVQRLRSGLCLALRSCTSVSSNCWLLAFGREHRTLCRVDGQQRPMSALLMFSVENWTSP